MTALTGAVLSIIGRTVLVAGMVPFQGDFPVPKSKQKQSSTGRLPSRWQQRFVSMLSVIEQQAASRLRGFAQHEREELLAETVALAFSMFVTLANRG